MNITLRNRLYRLKNFFRGKEWYYFTDLKCNLIKRGNLHSEWTFCPDNLNPDSIIYSFGVGKDISFDISLVNEFGVKVYLFDPTPGSSEYIKSLNLSSGYIFEAVGIADFDGKANFFVPESTKYDFSLYPINSNQDSIEVNVARLSTIAERLGHTSIDLLKMDIEGAEYSVIPDIFVSGINIRQILIEFHHRFSQNSIRMTRNAISLLRKYDYKLVHVSPGGEEFTFIKKD